MNNKNSKKSYFYAGLTVLLWSTVATAFKFGLRESDPPSLLLYSSLTSLIFYVILIRINSHNKIDFSINSLSKSMLSGFLNPFLYYMILFEAYSLLPAQIAQPLNYTWVIVVSILMSLFANQKLGVIGITGLIISFLGVIVLSSQGDISGIGIVSIKGVILALSSSLFWGLYWLLNVKDKRADDEKLFLNFLFGTIFILIYTLFFNKFQISFNIIIAGIYIGLCEMGLTFFVWLKALQYSPNTAKTGNIIYLTPFVSMIFIWLVLKEPISLYSILGLVFIISGILYSTYIKAFKSKKQ